MLEGTRTYNDLYYVGPQEKEQYLADIYRIWIQQEGVVAAHVNAAQHHTRSNYMRNPPAAEIFNEEVSNLIKRKVKDSVSRIHELCGFPRRAGGLPPRDAVKLES